MQRKDQQHRSVRVRQPRFWSTRRLSRFLLRPDRPRTRSRGTSRFTFCLAAAPRARVSATACPRLMSAPYFSTSTMPGGCCPSVQGNSLVHHVAAPELPGPRPTIRSSPPRSVTVVRVTVNRRTGYPPPKSKCRLNLSTAFRCCSGSCSPVPMVLILKCVTPIACHC